MAESTRVLNHWIPTRKAPVVLDLLRGERVWSWPGNPRCIPSRPSRGPNLSSRPGSNARTRTGNTRPWAISPLAPDVNSSINSLRRHKPC